MSSITRTFVFPARGLVEMLGCKCVQFFQEQCQTERVLRKLELTYVNRASENCIGLF